MAIQLRLGLLPYRWPWPDFYHRPCSASAPGNLGRRKRAEIARTRACELARRELDHSVNGEGVLTQLGDFPPVLRDVQPDIDEPEVRACLLKG